MSDDDTPDSPIERLGRRYAAQWAAVRGVMSARWLRPDITDAVARLESYAATVRRDPAALFAEVEQLVTERAWRLPDAVDEVIRSDSYRTFDDDDPTGWDSAVLASLSLFDDTEKRRREQAIVLSRACAARNPMRWMPPLEFVRIVR